MENQNIQSQTTRKLHLFHAEFLNILISILISRIFIGFGFPVIAYCAADDEQTDNDSIGAPQSREAPPVPVGEGTEAAESASFKKRKAEDDAGTSSVRQRVDSISKDEEEELWKKNDEWLLKNLSNLETKIQDEIIHLRNQEQMRPLGAERLAHITEDLGEKYGLDKLPEILNDIRTNQFKSEYYMETKVLIRELEREGYNAKMIRKDWAGRGDDNG